MLAAICLAHAVLICAFGRVWSGVYAQFASSIQFELGLRGVLMGMDLGPQQFSCRVFVPCTRVQGEFTRYWIWKMGYTCIENERNFLVVPVPVPLAANSSLDELATPPWLH